MRGLRTIPLLVLLASAALIPGSMPLGPQLSATVHAPLPTSGAPLWTPITEQHLNHGRFEDFTVYRPHATPRGFVVLLSGASGWNPAMAEMARRIARQGAMVTGVDLAHLNAKLEADGAQCVYPDGDLENLSHFVQAFYHLPTYLSPILGGYAAGGTFAYAILAQAPANTFGGAVSVGFCPGYASSKRLCKSSGLEYVPHTRDAGVDFLPSKGIGDPWIAIQPSNEPAPALDIPACNIAAVRGFVAQVPGAQLVTIPGAPAAAQDMPFWTRGYPSAFDLLLAQNAPATSAGAPSALGDLPIVVIPAKRGVAPTDTFAVMFSGDGGWAGLDKEVAGSLATHGVPVIGIDSLRYFWSARTPEGLASDVDRVIHYYLTQLGKQQVLLIGYSQGADVLPFVVNRLDSASRSHVVLAAIMGMSEHALFEFHVASWISDDNSGPPTLPEVEKISGVPVLCIYGEEESDSLCPKLDPHKFTLAKFKGGHHFDGDYDALARTILASGRH